MSELDEAMTLLGEINAVTLLTRENRHMYSLAVSDRLVITRHGPTGDKRVLTARDPEAVMMWVRARHARVSDGG